MMDLTPRARRIAARLANRADVKMVMSPDEYEETLSEMEGLLRRAAAARAKVERQLGALGSGARPALQDLREMYASLVGMVEANGWTVMGTTIR